MSDTNKTFDEEYVKELRQEAAKYRTQLRETESKLEEMSQMYSQRESELLDKEIILAAKSAGAVDPQTVLKLLDRESLTKDESGLVINLDEVVRATLDDKPFLKGGSVGKPSNPVGGNGQPRTFTREDLDSMTQDEINENWSEIEVQMSKGLIR